MRVIYIYTHFYCEMVFSHLSEKHPKTKSPLDRRSNVQIPPVILKCLVFYGFSFIFALTLLV